MLTATIPAIAPIRAEIPSGRPIYAARLLVIRRTRTFQSSDCENLAAIALEHSAMTLEIDYKRKIAYANDKFSAFLGLGGSLESFEKYCPQAPRELFRSLLANEKWNGVLALRGADGTLLYADVTVTPFFDAEGRLCKIIAIGFDVTPQKRQKENMMRLMRQEQAAAARLEAAKNDLEQKIYERTQELSDSIRYARRLQTALAPSMPDLRAATEEMGYRVAVLYQPRDVVGGDFYWLGRPNENAVVLAVGDGTGHGVPGAFMSLLGVTSLAKYVEERNETDPAAVLTGLDTDLLKILGAEVNDTIEISALTLEKDRLSYGSAMLGAFYATDTGVFDLPAARRPVGGTFYDRTKPFETHLLNLRSGETLYLFSDGFHSQHNDDDKAPRPMGKKTFRKFVNQVQSIPNLDERLGALHTFLKNWQGNAPQTDDILIMAVSRL